MSERQFIALAVCHWQVNADYATERGVVTKIFPASTSIGEVYDWYAALKPLGKGELVITEPQP